MRFHESFAVALYASCIISIAIGNEIYSIHEFLRDCSHRELENGLSYPFPNDNVYSSGTEVKYACAPDYELDGVPRASCFDGRWNELLPKCIPSSKKQPLFCFPPVIENGMYSPKRDRYSVGAEIRVRCRGKYYRDGDRRATCQDNSEWTSLPKCRMGCEEPKISGGFYNTQAIKTGSFFPSGSVVVVSCNDDYAMEGEKVQTCSDNGEWLPGVPFCIEWIVLSKEIGCKPPTYSFAMHTPDLPEGKDVYSVGDRISFLCEGDQHVLGHNFAECLSGGEWSKAPVCDDQQSNDCWRPWISNGNLDLPGESFKVGTVIRLTCDEGFLPVGQTSATCLSSGAWSANLRCTDGCYAPRIPYMQVDPAPEEGGDVYEFGKRINFRCDAGYSSSAPSAECRGKNRWDKELPKCSLLAGSGPSTVGCSYPNLTPGLILKNQPQDVYPYKTQLEFQCSSGYNMIGSAVSICRKHLNGLYGGLDPSPPRCERVKCGSPGKPQNGRFRDGERGDYYFGDEVYYVCDDKHIMSGSNKLTCQANGQFDGIRPTCQPPSCKVECTYVSGRECQCDAQCRFNENCCDDFEQHCRKLFY